MLACLRTAAVFGVEACPVHVEVDVSFGMPRFTMVGLPDASVRESRDRVRSAIRNSGFEFPAHRITVNLAPADVRKAGASFDLPIALGILAAQGIVERRHIADLVLLGELSLDGSIHPARGVLPIAAAAVARGPFGHLVAGSQRQRGGDRHRSDDLSGVVARRCRAGAQQSFPCSAVVRFPCRAPHRGTSPKAPTWLTFAVSSSPAARSRSPAPAATTCSSSVRRAPAKR